MRRYLQCNTLYSTISLFPNHKKELKEATENANKYKGRAKEQRENGRNMQKKLDEKDLQIKELQEAAAAREAEMKREKEAIRADLAKTEGKLKIKKYNLWLLPTGFEPLIPRF